MEQILNTLKLTHLWHGYDIIKIHVIKMRDLKNISNWNETITD